MAIARFSMASEAGVGSEDEVGIGGLLEAIERRRFMSGSAWEESILTKWI